MGVQALSSISAIAALTVWVWRTVTDTSAPPRIAARTARYPLTDDHRRGAVGAHRCDQRVQPAHPGVAVSRTLFTVPVDFDDRVVDVHEDGAVDPGDDRGPIGQPAQKPGPDGIELADVPEGEFTQERPQRRRCGGVPGAV